MAKIGLAAELAKQAAQAAREEVAATEAKANPGKAPTKGWSVPVIAANFALDDAVEQATQRVTGHYRSVLAPQGLDVELGTTQDAGVVAEVPQAAPELEARLREQHSGRLVKAYTAPALLTLFAAQQQATGIVVDGQV